MCGDESGLKIVEEAMQRAWYQKFVRYDPEWKKSIRLDHKPIEFDLSGFEVMLYNHYVEGDDTCDEYVNRRAIRAVGGDNFLIPGVEHSTIQRNNSDEVYKTLL